MDGNRPAMKIFSPEGVKAWCRDRAAVPLYQQQAELCEAAIKKMQTMPRVSDADKAEFAAAVKREINTLLQTKTIRHHGEPVAADGRKGILQSADREGNQGEVPRRAECRLARIEIARARVRKAIRHTPIQTAGWSR